MEEKYSKFATQFKDTSKEKIIKFLYEALEENSKTIDTILELISYCECVLEDGLKKTEHEDIRYIKEELESVIKYTRLY